MFKNLDRRSFLKKSAAASAGAALALSFEEKALLAEAAKQPISTIVVAFVLQTCKTIFVIY